MKVFISWSGELSQAVAIVLRDWLPSVIQSIRPYVSAEDIDKGARWGSEIAEELEDSEFGILCVTPDNIEAPWLNFEAGALSKAFDTSSVSPFLFGVTRTDVIGPLVQFQSTIAEKDDVHKLVRSLNKASGDGALDDGRLSDIFEVWWPRLSDRLDKLQGFTEEESSGQRRTPDLLTEILELVRGQWRLLSSPQELLPPDYIQFALADFHELRGHPAITDLARNWWEFRSIVEAFESGDPDAIVRLQGAIDELDRPITFILDRLHNPRRRRRRSPWRPSLIPEEESS